MLARNLVIILAIAAVIVLGAIMFFDARTQEAATGATVTQATPPLQTDAEIPEETAVAPAEPDTVRTPAESAVIAESPPQASGPWFDPAIAAAPQPLLHYGNENAPVAIEEYASFTCSHCGTFATAVLPELQAGMLAQGDAQLAMHSFIRNEPDLRATQLLSCITDQDRRERFAKTLFTMQDRWAYANDPVAALRQIATFGGIDGEQLDACLSNSELENALLAQQQETLGARKIESTPTFFIGSETLVGARPVEEFAAAVQKARSDSGL